MIKPDSIVEIWVYLSGSPLIALFITLVAYQIGLWAYQKAKQNPLVNPVAIAVILVASFIELIDMPYETYFQGAQFIHFLLGSATVALAIPIYRGIDSLKNRVIPLLVALLLGGAISIATGVGISTLLGADKNIIGAFYSKSVTAPIAMGIAERIGTSPTLTAIFAVCTGRLGALLAPYVLNLWRIKPWWQRGFPTGVASHGIGASRAFSINVEAGAYASLAMGLHGIAGSIAIPLIYKLFN